MEYPAKNGLFTDMSKTVAVGKIDASVQKLVDATKTSLDLAIKQVKPGNTLNDIGTAIQEYAEKNGFSVVRELVGHGVGYEVHEEPQVPNYKINKNSKDNIILKIGMVIAIEPMLNVGGWRVKTGEDGFSILTIDGQLSAHFEHTIAVTEEGNIVITAL
jgi:methionyl aminopeptidase